MIVRSEINVPDDYTKTAFTKMTSEQDFTVYIEPCLITSYDSLQTVSSIEYAIGALSLTGGSYAFVQTPECGYDESVTILNLPSFLTHNEATADFTV